ncbi:MAG TPA: hypothetical protein VH157_11660 [Bryobacteraceae bacterium]|jgi:dihydrodipicolinate synthase/N-acetylneuraminate lyase|nr:hypothetical protein [Bryobacteraceae bacterium]
MIRFAAASMILAFCSTGAWAADAGAGNTADIKKVATEGQGKMKLIAGLAGADLDNVVAYVQSLKK